MVSASSPILKAALLGQSLGHTISPALHSELFPLLREHTPHEYQEIEYRAVEVATPAEMFAWIAQARHDGYRGANVTYPYKQIAAEAIARPSKLARRLHSVNTLLFTAQIYSDSTDGAGFLTALQRRVHESFAGYDLIIIGAGGAARAILYALRDAPFASITVLVRDPATAKHATSILPSASVHAITDIHRGSNPVCVVQATPVGQESDENIVPNFDWRETDVAVDLVYRPLETAFLRAARAAHSRTVGGLGMLIEQAALSQLYWITGTMPQHSPLSERQFQQLHEQLSAQLR